MKLLHYTYRKLSLLLFLLMAVWGVLFYYAILDEVVDETDDTLENYARILIKKALHDPSILDTEGTLMSFYKFQPISEELGKHYADVLVSRLVLKGVFRPLHKLLDWLHGIQPGKEVSPLENPTAIREFRQLSEAAVDMGNRSYKAYVEQKQFIENASHELQTPLAIVRGKVELLAENEELTEQQMKELDAIYSTLDRAVKLNKSLLLLSRIENGQYAEMEDVSVDEVLDGLLPDLMDIYEHKQVRLVRKQGEGPFVIHCNHSLAQILISNLVKNSLLHNREGESCRLLPLRLRWSSKIPVILRWMVRNCSGVSIIARMERRIPQAWDLPLHVPLQIPSL